MDTKAYLNEIMSNYTVDNLLIPRLDFLRAFALLIRQGSEVEGFSHLEQSVQRDKTLEYHWGHNHDFGSFRMDGAMGDRHIEIMTQFIDIFGLPRDLTGANVLDVGVWCGGTTLLLAGMGADTLLGIEEVKKYAHTAGFLIESFIDPKRNIFVNSRSLYELGKATKYHVVFDYIIFPGVLYHLSDPILALRHLFNLLRDGGELYIETMTPNQQGEEPMIEYHGAQKKGWNWFSPNAMALKNMLLDVGFSPDEKVLINNNRLITKATRETWKPMIKAGLSRKIR